MNTRYWYKVQYRLAKALYEDNPKWIRGWTKKKWYQKWLDWYVIWLIIHLRHKWLDYRKLH